MEKKKKKSNCKGPTRTFFRSRKLAAPIEGGNGLLPADVKRENVCKGDFFPFFEAVFAVAVCR